MQYCSECRRVYPNETQYCPAHGTRLEARDGFAVGSLICGRYEVVRSLGKGNMGEVFLVDDRKLLSGNKRRAMKAPLERFLADKTYLDQFMNEADKTLALSHPNIVRSFHVDTSDSGIPFLLMEFLEGHELRYWMDREPRLQWRHIRQIALEIARALESAHAAGVVHCDMKPESVRSASPSHPTPVKVFDFGLAKAAQVLVGVSSTAGSGTVFGSEVVAGTLNYMAPEQAISRNKVSPKSDIYSLGVILFELFTGRLPHPDFGSVEEARQFYATQRPEPLRGVAGCPAAAADLVASMLDPSPEFRPSASDVVNTIEQIPESGQTLPPHLTGGTSVTGDGSLLGGATQITDNTTAQTPLWKRYWIFASVVLLLGVITAVIALSHSQNPVDRQDVASTGAGGGGGSAGGSGNSGGSSAYTTPYADNSQDAKLTGTPGGSSGSTPSQGNTPSQPAVSRLSVACDTDCYWYLDGVAQNSAEARLNPGTHTVRAVMAGDANAKYTQTKTIEAAGQDLRVEFYLMPLKRSDAQTISTYIQQAQSYYDNRDYPNALKTINLALSLDPENAEAANLKSQIVKMCEFNDVCGLH